MSSEVPEGFLVFNGQKVYQSVHSRLYALLAPLTQLTKGTDETGAYVQLPNLDGRVLQATSSASAVGQLLNASLPNIVGNTNIAGYSAPGITPATGAFAKTERWFQSFSLVQSSDAAVLHFDASDSSAVYQNGMSVQAPACLSLVAIRF